MKYDFETEVPCPYTTYKDLYDRLSGTICRYKGQPCYIETTEEYLALFSVDRRRLLFQISYDEVSEMDVSSVELGYVNHKNSSGTNKVYYVKRSVKRQFKQGVSQSNVFYEGIDGAKVGGLELLHTDSFEKSLMGVFPTFDEALSLIGRDGEVAISQEVALKALPIGLVLLYIRGKNFGWIAPNTRSINLEDSKLRWVAERQLAKYSLSIN